MTKADTRVVKSISGAAALALFVSGCGVSEPTPKFNNDIEKACYFEARDALPNENTKLARKGDRFVEVVTVEGFVRDQRNSKVFDDCMVRRFGDNAPNKLSAEGALTFTGEEQKIWNGLSDDERQAAYRFIREGGTLTEWAAGN